MNNQTPIMAANFARALSSLLRGTTFPSESDYPFEPFWAEMPSGSALDPETMRKAARISRRYEITVEPADDVLASLIRGWEETIAESEPPGQPSEYDQYVRIFRMLETVMNAALSDIMFVHAGGDDIVRARVFIVGRLPDGRLAGVRSISIET